MSLFGPGNRRAAKLTITNVLTIRERAARGETQGALGREFGVTAATVGRIVRREVWQQLPAAEYTDKEKEERLVRLVAEMQEKTALERLQGEAAVNPEVQAREFLKPEGAPSVSKETLEKAAAFGVRATPEAGYDEEEGK